MQNSVNILRIDKGIAQNVIKFLAAMESAYLSEKIRKGKNTKNACRIRLRTVENKSVATAERQFLQTVWLLFEGSPRAQERNRIYINKKGFS